MDEAETQIQPTTTPDVPGSVVDALFDTATVGAARALVGLQVALEGLARWIDGRAKDVGAFATKLAPDAVPSTDPEPPPEPDPAAATS